MDSIESTVQVPRVSKGRVNVALGGGGAKGFVHVGILKGIDEMDLEISHIVGTSMGALLGAIFAYKRSVVHSQKSPLDAQRAAIKGLEVLCLNTDFGKLRDVNLFRLLSQGVLKGNELEDWLKTQLWSEDTQDEIRFQDLPFDLTITATDSATGDSLILDKSTTPAVYVHSAVRASASIQGVFKDTNVEYFDKPIRCWDGGTTGNCRFDVALKNHSDNLTIVSSVTYRGEPVSVDRGILQAWRRFTRIREHSISILMRQLENVALECLPVELRERVCVIRPNLSGVSTFAFSINKLKKQELFRNGHIAAKNELGKFLSQFK